MKNASAPQPKPPERPHKDTMAGVERHKALPSPHRGKQRRGGSQTYR